MTKEISEIILNIPTKEFIEWRVISPKWNGEKISEETSYLIHFTWEKCFNCLSSEWTWLKADYYSVRYCYNPKTLLKWGLNSASWVCAHHE